jgi:hypothetical protein
VKETAPAGIVHSRVEICLLANLIVLFLLACFALPADAFSLRPTGTDRSDRIMHFVLPAFFQIWYPAASRIATEHFTTPVHERATNLIYGCEDDGKICEGEGKSYPYAPAAVLAGNQWNDNPPFELASTNTRFCSKYVGTTIKAPYFLECWYILYRDGEKRAEKGEYFDAESGTVLLYRVHFGDMQFLHAMASRDGEEARVTKERIMMWAEFTYKLALGELDRGAELRKIRIPGMETLFRNRGWTSQQLFTRGDPTYRSNQDFRDFAFGSLLHLVEDSFSRSHTERDEPSGAGCEAVPEQYNPGTILSFHSYARQDKRKHAEADRQNALSIHLAEKQPNVVDVGKALKAYYDRKRPWEEVKLYLECVFQLADPAAAAGPGTLFTTAGE